jgi:NAD(P)H-hydrate repair Nnr-like enzyme with NAD(P)H-hydrate dehydratase domain
VLSGILASVCSYAGAEQRVTLAAIVTFAAYINGAAGEMAAAEYGDISMIASDTVSSIPKVIKELST